MNMPFIKANKNRYTWSWISSYIGKFPYSLLRSTHSFYAGVLLLCRSAYSLADYTLISFWWSQVCHHQSADMPHAQAMCWSVVCISNGEGGRGKLQTVLISYASHVASSTNRRYLIEILITVGTHSHTHTRTVFVYSRTLWHSMTTELWSSLHFFRTCCVWEPCLLSFVVS